MLATFVRTTLFWLKQGVMFLVFGGDMAAHRRRIICGRTVLDGWKFGGGGG